MPAHTLQITIGASATKIADPNIPTAKVKNASFQNNGANNMRIGDSTVTTSLGILLYPSGGSASIGPFSPSIDLNQLYVAGTQNDVLDILYFD